MTGLFLLLVLGGWGWLSLKMAHGATAHLARPGVRVCAKGAVFLALLPVPLADEIISGVAYRRVCEEETKLVLLNDQLAGQTLWYTGATSVPRRIGLLAGTERKWNYVVAETEAPAYHYTDFTVRGGFLMTLMGISQTSSPLLFERGCGSDEAFALNKRLNITVVDKPQPPSSAAPESPLMQLRNLTTK